VSQTRTLTINGESKSVDVPDDMPLLWVLRDVLGMTGNLPIDRNTALDFMIGSGDEAVLARLPKNQPIVPS